MSAESPVTSDRIQQLDGWRGIAILLVLLDHFFRMPTGGIGVDIFFSLSGFLMSGILFKKRVRLTEFYRRRCSRILPVFLLYVALVYLYALIVGNPESSNFLFTASFLRSYLPERPTIFHTDIPIGHLWSLNVEEHCYVLLSALTLLAMRIRATAWVVFLLGVSSIGVFVIYHFVPEYQSLYFQLRTEAKASHLLVSAGYCLLAQEYKWELSQRWLFPLALALASCYIGVIPGANALLAPFIAAILVHHLGNPGNRSVTFLTSPALVALGLWSYSIYIWQQVFYFSVGRFVVDTLATRALGLLLSIAIGALSYRFYETPIRRFINEASLRPNFRLPWFPKRRD